MPLKRGKSDKTIKGNIKELVHSYKKTGKIGNTKPENIQKAVKEAVAIAYNKAGRSKK